MRTRQDYSRGISITSSSMISPNGASTCSVGVRLHVTPVKGLHQERENGPPNANCIASQHGILPHLPVSPFRRSIPWRWHNNHDPWWEKAGRRVCVCVSHASSNTQLGHVSQRKWRFLCQKRFKLMGEALIPFSGFNKDEELWMSKNPFIASFKVQIYVINYWLS